MIPQKKKTPEEIAALREGLGIPDSIPQPGEPRKRPDQLPEMAAAAKASAEPKPEPAKPEPEQQTPLPVLDPAHPDESPHAVVKERIVHLDMPSPPAVEEIKPEVPVVHSLRKNELPLAPAPAVTHKTALPSSRHEAKDLAEMRRRAAIQGIGEIQNDPAAHLRKMTAHWLLLVPAYFLAFGAALAAWQRVHHFTPLVLLVVSALLAIFIFARKKRSRHHAAILCIIILMTLVFGGLHYAPLFQYAP